MKATVLASALFLATLGAAPLVAHADGKSHAGDNVPAPQNIPYPGTVKISVDASDITHRIFNVHETIPVQPGPMYLLYPEWIPGHHSPSNPIDKVAGLVVRANGKVLPWKRDQYNVYAFRVEVPEGVSSIDVEFKFLAPQDRSQGAIIMTPEMLNLSWNKVSLYPAGYYAKQIPVSASVTLPKGWKMGTALEVASQDGATTTFKKINYDDLVDSPIYAGKYYKRVDLSPGDKYPPVYMDIVADAPKYLEITPEQLKIHRNIVTQMYKLYGAFHFDHYEFLISLSDKMSGKGLEHHRSSEDGMHPEYFTEWDSHKGGRDLLTHEFNHSWNGKYRRGADLTTPNFNVPMGDSLLWVYEGQTQFWGNVVAVRAGLESKETGLQKLAYVAANYDMNRPGMQWRTLQDTTNDPTIAQRAPLPYRNYQMSEDYYSGGQMVWLAVDAKLRSLSDDEHSLDDFAKAFFGMNPGDWNVLTYTYEDVVKTLNDIQPYDWDSFLRTRLDGHEKITDGIAASGWKLVYTSKPSDAVKAMESKYHRIDLTYSVGFSASSKGGIRDVRWDGPAFKAGLAPSMTLIAVNGVEFSADSMKQAVKDAKDSDQPIELLVKNFNEYKTIKVDYHGGLKYPHLERVKGKPDYLSELYAPKK